MPGFRTSSARRFPRLLRFWSSTGICWLFPAFTESLREAWPRPRLPFVSELSRPSFSQGLRRTKNTTIKQKKAGSKEPAHHRDGVSLQGDMRPERNSEERCAQHPPLQAVTPSLHNMTGPECKGSNNCEKKFKHKEEGIFRPTGIDRSSRQY